MDGRGRLLACHVCLDGMDQLRWGVPRLLREESAGQLVALFSSVDHFNRDLHNVSGGSSLWEGL